MPKLYENVDYALIADEPFEDRLFDAVKVLVAPYKDITVRIGMLKFSDTENKDGTLSVGFDFEVISAPPGVKSDELDEDRTFGRLLGDILINILEDQLGEKEPDAGEFTVRDADPEVVED